MRDKKELFAGCLLGGAIGDALGYPVEFMKYSKILEEFGAEGITELKINQEKNKAIISDDTQMTLFTADGLIWAYERMRDRGSGSYTGSGIYQSYLRWYYTQTGVVIDEFWLKKQPHEEFRDDSNYPKSILDHKELFERRTPGPSCLNALSSGEMGTIERPINNSKGCGGIMRVAPIGVFLHKNPEEAFQVGAEVAAITHGHPTGYLAAGTLACIIAEFINGRTILESINSAIEILKGYSRHEETLKALEKAIDYAKDEEKTGYEVVKKLGQGWVAEEALAIAVYCALKNKDFKSALIMAVNHDGDSDSTGAICGNILGAAYGRRFIPEEWIDKIELKEFMEELGDRLCNLA
ncbi:MAG: ADP-ribosylglycohydrolase family protein [Clostridium sp.]|nr:ADP-ribosylglycohydrolase family protein [Clostridium sp.]MDU7083830.1 ADP-ribosylglycohydrolase family protein [Clostridium sp.]